MENPTKFKLNEKESAMENLTKFKLNQRRWAVRMGLTIGLALLFLAALLWGLQGVTPARADPGTLYVDGASGQDIPTCGTAIAPCQTISYTLNTHAVAGDVIRVAQGTYTETLTVNISITLEGGYSGPPGWTQDLTLYETILDGSGSTTIPGDWDESMYAPAVIVDGGVYKMWYTGHSDTGGSGIGYAESNDGIQWTRSISNPVLVPGDPGAWDAAEIGQPSVIKQGGQYKMWYFASDENFVKQIGYATSPDGITWTKYAGNPVLTVGDPGEWDETEVGGPRVVFDGVTYHLWYHGYSGECCDSIGYATSPDGINWTKHPTNPVFGPGDPGEWDDTFVFFTAVLSETDHFDMWYSVGGGKIGIGYVTSTNGINWTRFLTGPVLTNGDPGDWDENYISAPTVVHEGGLYRMWYGGCGDSGGGFGYATSTDGISWTKSISNPVFLPGAPAQWGQPVVRFEAGSDGSVLDGFAITGGDTNEGGGVLITGVGPVGVANSVITGNYADHGGGGIMIDGDNAQAQITNVVIEHNEADYGGGIAVRSGASAFISGTRIISNTANESGGGVGIWAEGPIIVMANTVISDNYGHHAGGLAMWEPGGTFTGANLLVVDNRSGPGTAGIALGGSSGGQLMNVTVAGNDSATGFDGAEVEGPVSGFPIVNSIFWGNGTNGSNLGGNNLNVSYSDVQGGFAGTGNIDADPLFIGGGDYHLGVGSPCIDKGTSAGAPTHDIEGTPRDAAPDMGAYEWTGFRIFLPLTLKNFGS